MQTVADISEVLSCSFPLSLILLHSLKERLKQSPDPGISIRLTVLIPDYVGLIRMIISSILTDGKIHTTLCRIIIQHGRFHIGKNLCLRAQRGQMPYVYKILRRDGSIDLRHLKSIPHQCKCQLKWISVHALPYCKRGIRTDFPEKFGIPRQSGVVGSLQAEIIFEPEFRSRDAVRGLEAFSHIWLIWEFSENVRADWSPTVRPPRLGGNVRMGVFATRSPFRPNPIGLSCVRLEDITFSDARGPVLHVAGADLMDGTPIYEIKPYIP